MTRAARRLCSAAIVLLGLTRAAAPAYASLGVVVLTDGTRLRGDVTETPTEVILRNAAGEARFSRAEVDRVEYDPPLPPPPAPDGPAPESAPVTQPDSAPAPEGAPAAGPLEPPPMLSERDINRLRLFELRLNPSVEEIAVRFTRARGEPELTDRVKEDLAGAPDFDPEWSRILDRGKPHEKLGLILRRTGMKYADRIELRADPEVFQTFRRRVLPIVLRGCARSGCHAGPAAQGFRFPVGPQQGEPFAYTTFALLDGMHTPSGPMIDRENPPQSVLLGYLLPAAQTSRPHPPVKRGRLAPPLRSALDPEYLAIIEWIGSLRIPRPDYGLERLAAQESGAASAPAGSQPAR